MKRRYLVLGAAAICATLLAVWRFGYHGVDPRLILRPPIEDRLAPPAALAEMAALDIDGVPLASVLQRLALRHNVAIELDSFALQETGLVGDEPVTCRLSGVKLGSLLERLLAEFDFTVRHRDGVIYATTDTAWDRPQNYFARVYRIDRLLAGPFGPINETGVEEVIRASIALTSWSGSGGSGEMRTLPGAVVVGQTADIHEQIAALLDRLAEVADSPDPPTAMRVYPADNKRSAEIRQSLDQPLDIQADKQPLRDFCQDLSQRLGVPIQIDVKSLDGVGVDPKTPITAQLTGVSARSALRIILRDLDLTFVVQDDLLLVTTPEVSDNRLTLCVFPVGDLVRQAGWAADYDTLIDLITSTVAPTTWDYGGGPANIDGIAGTLVLSQTDDVLDQIESLLSDLRQGLLPESLAGTTSMRTAAERLEQAFSQPVSCDFVGAPLREAAAHLTRQCGVNILVDVKSLDGIGVSPDEPITFKADNLPLLYALRHMVHPLQLVPVARDECLIITSPEIAGNTLETRCYRVRDLFESTRRASGPSIEDFDSLTDAIRAAVDPTNWGESGGFGYIDGFPGGVLVVSQTAHNQEKIAELLGRLQQLFRGPSAGETILIGDRTPEQTVALERRLDESVSFEVLEARFPDVLDYLRDESHLPIRLDWVVRSSPSYPAHSEELLRTRLATYSAKNLPLRTALAGLLQTWEVTYGVQEGEIRVVEQDAPWMVSSLRLYDLRDLTPFCESPADSLRDVLDLDADAGSHEHYRQIFALDGLPDRHRRVEQLLAALRRASRSPASIDPLLVGETTLNRVTRVYPLADLRQAAGRRLTPFAEFDVIHGFHAPPGISFSGGFIGPLSDFRLPEVRYYDDVRLWRPDPLPDVLERALKSPKVNGHYNDLDSVWFGDYFIVSAWPETDRQFAAFLAKLRRLLIDHLPLTQDQLAVKDFLPLLDVYDLRAVLTSYPELDERQIAELVRFASVGLRDLDFEALDPLESLPGLLVLGQSCSAEWVANVCDVLLHQVSDLPRPSDLVRGDSVVVQHQLVQAISAEQNDLRLGYLLWLAQQVEHPIPGLHEAVSQRLEATLEKPGQALLQRQLCGTIASLGPGGAGTLHALQRFASTAKFDRFDARLLADAWCAQGLVGQVALCRWATTILYDGVLVDAVAPALKLRTVSAELLPELLGMAVNRALQSVQTEGAPLVDLQGLRSLVWSIDPNGSRTRQLIDEWEKSQDEQLKHRAKWLRDFLNLPPVLNRRGTGGLM